MFTAPAKVGAESFFGVGSYESNVLKFSPAFWDTHTLVQESFRPPLRIRTHPFRKVFARLCGHALTHSGKFSPAFADTHTPINESFGQAFSKACAVKGA